MTLMKTLPVVAVAILALFMVGCRSGREYYEPPRPRYQNSFSIIISPSPGFMMQRHPNGRYYHRSHQGYIYWRGYDNRFYLDRKYMGRVRYNDYEYREWKRRGRKYGRGYDRW
ncbi:MAG TPA: hypothetical protein VFO70_06240 [Chitinophagaceae bacterium]|nr:hypothetical protein [Chitinophagaceae bacterium]